jgi:hypothetical protein
MSADCEGLLLRCRASLRGINAVRRAFGHLANVGMRPTIFSMEGFK